MNRKWQSKLADDLQGEQPADKALLSIAEAVRRNLRHESIGMYMTALPRLIGDIDLSTPGKGTIAVRRYKNLLWSDFNPVAKGEKVMTPQTGNVDTLQIHITESWYSQYRYQPTDFSRLLNSGTLKAELATSLVNTRAAAMDVEFLDLLIITALGRKGCTFVKKIGTKVDWNKSNWYLQYTNVVNGLEQTMNSHYIGVPRKEITSIWSPKLHSYSIRELPGNAILADKPWQLMQSEGLSGNGFAVGGVTHFRNILLDNDNNTTKPDGVKRNYNFKGIHSIINYAGAAALFHIFQEANSLPDGDRGGIKTWFIDQWGKGIIHEDLVRIIIEPSTPENPHEWEKYIVENRHQYNGKFGFGELVDGKPIVEIPDTVEKLQANYINLDELDKNQDLPPVDSPDEDHSPENWAQRTFNNASVTWHEDGKLEVNNLTCWRADEDWANNEGANEGHKNWFDFNKEFSGKKGRPLRFKRIVMWSTTDWRGYIYCVPVAWTKNDGLKKLKSKPKSKLIDA